MSNSSPQSGHSAAWAARSLSSWTDLRSSSSVCQRRWKSSHCMRHFLLTAVFQHTALTQLLNQFQSSPMNPCFDRPNGPLHAIGNFFVRELIVVKESKCFLIGWTQVLDG